MSLQLQGGKMALSKDQAVKLATEHLRRAVEKELSQYFRECEVRDVLPDEGNTYWSLPGDKEDYWYIEVPHIYRERPLHVGGGSKYLAICKQTGAVSTVTVQGE